VRKIQSKCAQFFDPELHVGDVVAARRVLRIGDGTDNLSVIRPKVAESLYIRAGTPPNTNRRTLEGYPVDQTDFPVAADAFL